MARILALVAVYFLVVTPFAILCGRALRNADRAARARRDDQNVEAFKRAMAAVDPKRAS